MGGGGIQRFHQQRQGAAELHSTTKIMRKGRNARWKLSFILYTEVNKECSGKVGAGGSSLWWAVTVSERFYLISHRGSQLFVGRLHRGPGGPHFDASAVHIVSLLLLEKLSQKRKLITVESRTKGLQ